MHISAEERRAVVSGASATLVLAALIVAGSRNLNHFDAALVGYTFATLFATFGITYRYAMWLSRPPTRLYWRRGWALAAWTLTAIGLIKQGARAIRLLKPADARDALT